VIFIEDLYKEAGKITMETLPAFLDKLGQMPDTYNDGVHIVAAAGIAAAWALNGHIGCLSNIGASQVMWDFIKSWMDKKGPMRLICFEDMLYPQFEYRFEKTVDFETAEWLRITAHNKMQTWFKGHHCVAPEVFWHWHSLDCGILPFGYRKEGSKPLELKTQADVLKAWSEGKLVLK
jgi:hypothetical protein